MNRHRIRLRIFLNFFVVVLCIYGIFLKDDPFQTISPLENFLINGIASAQKYSMKMQRYFMSLSSHYINNIDASKDNRTLRVQNELLQEKIFSYREILQENKRLKNLLNYSEELRFTKILARIVSMDASLNYKVLRIDKGIEDGVYLQAAVLTPKGVVGYVYRLTRNYSDVLTIIDSNNRIDALIKRIRVHGIVEGSDEKECHMKYVSRIETIILGDEVITAGFGNVYPKGLSIGTVSSIERASYGIVQKIKIIPSVVFENLEEVFVLTSKEQKDRQREWDMFETLNMEKEQ